MLARSIPRRSGIVILPTAPVLPMALLVALLWCGHAFGESIVVEISGVNGALLPAVQSALTIQRQKDHPLLNAALAERLHRRAADEIRRALAPFGYYDVRVESSLDLDSTPWKASYRVDAGDPVVVEDLRLEITGPGSVDSALAAALDRFPLHRGDVLVHGKYEEGKRTLQSAALSRGYLEASYRVHRVEVVSARKSAAVTLILDTGPRYRLGAVTFVQDFLEEDYLRGFVTFAEGDPYSLDVLLDLQSALTATRQFRRVDVRAPREEAVGLTVPVTVHLEAGPARRFTAGLGYGTDTGPRLRLGWEYRRLNRDVHRLKSELMVSQVRSEFLLRYTIPLDRPRTDHLDHDFGWSRERVEDIESTTFQLGSSVTTIRGRVQSTYSLVYSWEEFNAAGNRDISTLLIPGAAWSYVRADDRIFTRRGYRIGLELDGAWEGLLSTVSFQRAIVRAKGIVPLGAEARLIARLDAGAVAVDPFDDLPVSLRFFAGGDLSVRGYAYKSLGPEDSDGEVIGGRYLIVSGLDLERSIAPRWALALFVDVGNALDELSDPLRTGAGVGVRWRSLVGMIRLDIAQAVSDEEKPWRIHLNIGPDL